MRVTLSAVTVLAALFSSAASAQSVNLTGQYRCVEACRDGQVGAPAFVTQNGDNLNLRNEIGQSSPAVPDWNAPASRLWIDGWNESAVYSPDGMVIQFDDGTIWQRDLGLPPPLPLLLPRRRVVY